MLVQKNEKKERAAYIEYIDEQYNADRLTNIFKECIRYYRRACLEYR
ncbi:hypothetical protein GCM10020331_059930 [Ectobacillus funiculus]